MAEHIALREPVVAYRGWFARPVVSFQFVPDRHGRTIEPVAPEDSEFGLFPISNVIAWDAGVNTAVCRPPLCEAPPGPHGASPDPHCRCGLHSHPRLGGVLTGCTTPFGVSPQWIVGAVLTWGAMYSGGQTIRASHAEVIALSRLADGDLAAHRIARLYGVPCVPRANLRDVALEHGNELPPEVLHEIKGGGWS